MDLQSNNISGIGGRSIMMSLCPTLNNSPPQIVSLNLSNNQLGRGNDFIKELANRFESDKFHLQDLNLAQNGINDNQIETLCIGLESIPNTSLTKLNLSKNQITDSGIKHIAWLFDKCDGISNIAELYLGWNKISGPGAASVAQIMRQNPKLKVMDLCWNGLGQGHR